VPLAPHGLSFLFVDLVFYARLSRWRQHRTEPLTGVNESLQ
jgi:hypothetical protein